MSDFSNTGNSIQLMRNVPLFTRLIKRGQQRAYGLPGLLVFSGEPGLGKSYASAYAAANLDAVHISLQEMWTKKTLLQQILRELRIPAKGTNADMMMAVNEGLAKSGRTLIIDEADYAVKKHMLPMIRDMQDGSNVPVVLVGMELLPELLKKDEKVSSRVLAWQQAQYADVNDARMLATLYAPGIAIADDLLAVILERNGGIPRNMATDLAHVLEQCRLQGIDEINEADWGNAALTDNQPPAPRNNRLGALA